MKRRNRNWIVAVALSLSFLGCGGGGGGGGSSPAPVPQEALTGTYRQTGFTFVYSNGQTITEANVSSWSGSVDIGPTTMNLRLVVAGQVSAVVAPYTAIWDSPTSGTIYESGSPSFTFTLSGGKLTFIMKGIKVSTGLTADGWFYFQKTSNSYTSKSVETEDTTSVDIYEGLGELMQGVYFQ
jgi:hypothetical protein